MMAMIVVDYIIRVEVLHVTTFPIDTLFTILLCSPPPLPTFVNYTMYDGLDGE